MIQSMKFWLSHYWSQHVFYNSSRRKQIVLFMQYIHCYIDNTEVITFFVHNRWDLEAVISLIFCTGSWYSSWFHGGLQFCALCRMWFSVCSHLVLMASNQSQTLCLQGWCCLSNVLTTWFTRDHINFLFVYR